MTTPELRALLEAAIHRVLPNLDAQAVHLATDAVIAPLATLLDRIEAQEKENAALRESLRPFAAYMKQMNAYAMIHRGEHLPDGKVMAYSQTEMGTSAALVVGHFRDALHVMEGEDLPVWSGLYRSKLRAALTPQPMEEDRG